jgi:hypothetical protein
MTGVGRTADELNAAIRALWPAGAVQPLDRNRYERLLVEWAEAARPERGEQQLAA